MDRRERDYMTELFIARSKRRLTLYKAADAIGVNYSTLQSWEMKRRKPKFDAFIKWCDYLDIKI